MASTSKTKSEPVPEWLVRRARKLGVPAPDKLTKAELLDAIKDRGGDGGNEKTKKEAGTTSAAVSAVVPSHGANGSRQGSMGQAGGPAGNFVINVGGGTAQQPVAVSGGAEAHHTVTALQIIRDELRGFAWWFQAVMAGAFLWQLFGQRVVVMASSSGGF